MRSCSVWANLLLLLLPGVATAAASHSMAASFGFSNVYGDGMVLQSAPRRAMVWGVCPHGGDQVEARFGSAVLNASVALYGGNWTWAVTLPPTAASFAEHDVVVTSAAAGRSIRLAKVLFGDVWVCSGQSNMVLGMKQIDDAEAELATQTQYPHIRELVLSGGSDTPQILARNTSACEDQNATCPLTPTPWHHGRSKPPSHHSVWGEGACVGSLTRSRDFATHTGTHTHPHTNSLPLCPARSRSRSPRADVPWRNPNGSELDSHLSAMCWLWARDMYAALDPPRPLGTIVAAQCGTPDEPFSSADALAKCEDPAAPYPKGSTALWNGMVVPLLNTTIYGVVWYQGEGNVKNPGGRYGGCEDPLTRAPAARATPSSTTEQQSLGCGAYIQAHSFVRGTAFHCISLSCSRADNCTFPAMIADWRAKWSEGTAGATDPQFPFGFVQLNGYGGGSRGGPFVPKYNNPLDADPGNPYSTRWGFAAVRWAQTAGFGYVPNPAMPKTFMAVILDTANPSGGVHSSHKQPAAARLARATLSSAYGVDTGTLAPRVASVKRGGNGTAAVRLRDLGTGVQVHNTTGFEAMVVSPRNGSQGTWVSTPVIAHDAGSVTLGGFPAGATRLRYLWYQDACGLETYGCAVYTTVPAIGNLSGELTFLPLAPFIMDL